MKFSKEHLIPTLLDILAHLAEGIAALLKIGIKIMLGFFVFLFVIFLFGRNSMIDFIGQFTITFSLIIAGTSLVRYFLLKFSGYLKSTVSKMDATPTVKKKVKKYKKEHKTSHDGKVVYLFGEKPKMKPVSK